MRTTTPFVGGTVLCLALASGAALCAQDCNNPPTPPSNCMGTSNCSTWWSEYEAWCVKNGGTPNESDTTCKHEPNWCHQGDKDTNAEDGSSGLANALAQA